MAPGLQLLAIASPLSSRNNARCSGFAGIESASLGVHSLIDCEPIGITFSSGDLSAAVAVDTMREGHRQRAIDPASLHRR